MEREQREHSENEVGGEGEEEFTSTMGPMVLIVPEGEGDVELVDRLGVDVVDEEFAASVLSISQLIRMERNLLVIFMRFLPLVA